MRGESCFRYEPDPMSKMFRRECSDCGSSDLEWMAPRTLVARVPDGERAAVERGVAFVGDPKDAWRCGACGNFGLM